MHNSQHKEYSLPLGIAKEGNIPVTLQGNDFERHKHIIGISGSGKSSLLACICILLLRLGVAFCLLDPHGDLGTLVLSLLASSDFFNNPIAFEKLWYIDFNRSDSAIAWNVLKQSYSSHTIAENILEATKRAWVSSTATPSLDNVILASSYVLSENSVPLTQLNRFLLDANYRELLLKNITDSLVLEFFRSKFQLDKTPSQLIDSTLRRVFLLSFSPALKNPLSQKQNKLNFRYLMDNGISCILNLGGLSDYDKRFLGCLLMVNLEQAFLSRATMSQEQRLPYHVIVDEFPLFSASEDSFSVVLEQVRKYRGTLYLAHQTTSQLSKGISGSLQNAISIIMKLGYEDSTWAAQRFARKDQQTQPGLFSSLFGLSPRQKGAFDTTENIQQDKHILETLERQEAIVTINHTPIHIKTHTLPHVTVDKKTLREIEDTYARRLLTPLSQIEREQTSSHGVMVASAPAPSVPIAKRRVPVTPPDHEPCQTFIGASGTEAELQTIFSLYGGYLTVSMIAKLLGKSENTARNKLKKLVPHILEQQNVPRITPSGKTPTVFSLKKGTRKYEFLEHRLATAEILVNTALFPTVASDIRLIELQSDDHLRASPLKLPNGNILVPDGLARLVSSAYEYAIYYEIDRNTELLKEKITTKLNNYKMLASQRECMVVAFCVVEGGDLRVKTLKNWAADFVPVELRELFLFAHIDLDTLTPETLFLSPIWSSIGHTPLQSLIET